MVHSSVQSIHSAVYLKPSTELRICDSSAHRSMLSPDPNALSESGMHHEASGSFEELALPLLSSLYRHAFWLSRNHTEAEDLVQEAIAKSLRAFDSFQQGTNFKAWIFRILRNTFLTSRTGIASARTVFLEDQPDLLDTADAGPTPEDHLIRIHNQDAVLLALEQLPPHLREVLLLCDMDELKYKDIAAVLDIPIGTVMSRISRARRTLQQLLQPQFRKPL